MAEYNGFSVALSKDLLRSISKEVDYMCKSCQDHESKLKEALDELSSTHTIIYILQNELLTYKPQQPSAKLT